MPRKQRRRITIALASLAALFLIQILNFVQQIPLPASKEPARFYSNQVGDDLEALYSQVIDRAKHSILLVIYSLSDPTVLDALNRKAEEGISVTVLYDAEASRSIKRELHPKISATARNSKGLMHQKILVIDSEEVWIGSANMTRASLRHHANLCMGVHAPLLAEHITHRADLMRHRSEIAPASATRFLFEQQEFELWWLPNEAALDRLVSLIHGAQKTVRVAMYTWTHPRLSAACIEAQRRGVDVRIVIDGEAAAGAGAAVVQELANAQVPLRLSRGPELLHHKFALIDGTICIHGSANWTRSAFKRNDEVLCISTPLTEEQRLRLEDIWGRCWSAGRER